MKEAFQKLEEFTSSMEQKSKEMVNQQESMSGFTEEVIIRQLAGYPS